MTPPTLALIFTSLFVAKWAHVTPFQQPLDFILADVGQSVTLECLCQEKESALLCYWYKQTVGQKLKLVSTFSRRVGDATLEKEFNNSRFSLDTKNHQNHLKISNLTISDSATYYCVLSSFYTLEFRESIIVSVKSSGWNIQTSVRQSKPESVKPGGSVTLNCTVHSGSCEGEHSVFWFKKSNGPHSRLFYTQENNNDQCEQNQDTQEHTCVYDLPMENLNRSDAGTYYCALASCGHVLFGKGTKVDLVDDDRYLGIVYFLSAALAFTIILVVMLGLNAYRLKKKLQIPDSRITFSATPVTNPICEDGENLQYAAVSHFKAKASRRKTDDPTSECVYSSMRQ